MKNKSSTLHWAAIVFGTVMALAWWLGQPQPLTQRPCRTQDFQYVLGWKGTQQIPGRAVTSVTHLRSLQRSPHSLTCSAFVTRQDGASGWYHAVITRDPKGGTLITVSPGRK